MEGVQQHVLVASLPPSPGKPHIAPRREGAYHVLSFSIFKDRPPN